VPASRKIAPKPFYNPRRTGKPIFTSLRGQTTPISRATVLRSSAMDRCVLPTKPSIPGDRTQYTSPITVAQ